jgi:hypothetical protein
MTDPAGHVRLLEQILTDVERELCGKRVPRGSQWANLKAIARSMRRRVDQANADKEEAYATLARERRKYEAWEHQHATGLSVEAFAEAQIETFRLRRLVLRLLEIGEPLPQYSAAWCDSREEIGYLPETHFQARSTPR